MELTRRNLLGVMAGGGLMPLTSGLRVAMGADGAHNIFVFIFLRGGMDGLQLLAPLDNASFQDKRGGIAFPIQGVGGGLPVGNFAGEPFFLHPDAAQLKQMFDDKKLAFVHAAGVPVITRSHFESQGLIDAGAGSNDRRPGDGWLARHLRTKTTPLGDFAATTDTVTASSPLNGTILVPTANLEYLPNNLHTDRGAVIAAVNSGSSEVARSAQKTVRMLDTIRERSRSLPPDVGNLNYTYEPFSQSLKALARVIKMGLGIEAAVVDFRGVWDTHEVITFAFSRAIRELSNALFAFTDDLGPALMNRVTIVAATEFGRRVLPNASMGTDHGAGSVMMALGAGVNGGRIYGEWPGLKDTDLDGGDLPVTTDYRQVLAEVLVNRMGQNAVEQLFPTLNYRPLGLARTG